MCVNNRNFVYRVTCVLLPMILSNVKLFSPIVQNKQKWERFMHKPNYCSSIMVTHIFHTYMGRYYEKQTYMCVYNSVRFIDMWNSKGQFFIYKIEVSLSLSPTSSLANVINMIFMARGNDSKQLTCKLLLNIDA